MMFNNRDAQAFTQAITPHQTVNTVKANKGKQKMLPLSKIPPSLQIAINEVPPQRRQTLQIAIDEMQVIIREPRFSDIPNNDPYSAAYTYVPLDSESNDPLTFTSGSLMGVEWKVFEPPAELMDGIGECINYSRRNGVPELQTLLTTSIGRASATKPLEATLSETAVQPGNTVTVSTLKQNVEAYSPSNITVAGPSRAKYNGESSSSANITVAGPSRPKYRTNSTSKDISSIEQNEVIHANSQQSTQTDVSSDSGYMSSTERYQSRSILRILGYSKLSPFARFRKLLEKRKEKGKAKSVARKQTEECVSCLDDFSKGETVAVGCHEYCKECFESLVTVAMETESIWPVKCCLEEISHEIILKNINSSLAKKFTMIALERRVKVEDRIYCNKPKCGAWIPNTMIKKSINCASCPKCKTKVCITCRNKSHSKSECPQDEHLRATIQLAEENGWKQCYNCNALVERKWGCRHMRCRCRAEFCYACTAKWTECRCMLDYTHMLESEVTVALGAQARRATSVQTQVQTLQNTREQELNRRAREEERIAVQLVEDFERRQAEELGREAERQRRRQEEEEENIRHRRVEARISEISSIFEEIREELLALHISQTSRFALRSQQEYRRLQEREMELNKLRVWYSQTIKLLETEYETESSKQELRFLHEYNERRKAELRVEKENAEKIEAFWKDKPDSVYEIRAEKDRQQEEYKVLFSTWNSNREATIQDLAKSFESRKSSLIESQKLDIHQANSQLEIDWINWGRKKVAEVQWFEAVIEDRESMLQTLETQHYATAIVDSVLTTSDDGYISEHDYLL